MAIVDAISNFLEQMAEPFLVLYNTITQYILAIWNSLTAFQKVLFALVLYLPVLYLIYKTLRNIQKEKERQFLKYLLMVDLPDGQNCADNDKTNGTIREVWDGNSADFADLENTSTLTYSFWIKVDKTNFFKNSYNGPRCILAKGNISASGNIENPMPAFWILNDNFTSRLWCLVYTDGGPTNGEGILLEDFPINELFQLCMTINGTAMNIYINGELVRTTVLSGPIMSNASDLIKAPLQIEATADSPANKGFLGCLNLLRISNKAFDPEQIRKFYNNEKLFLENKLSAYDLTGKIKECACPTTNQTPSS